MTKIAKSKGLLVGVFLLTVILSACGSNGSSDDSDTEGTTSGSVTVNMVADFSTSVADSYPAFFQSQFYKAALLDTCPSPQPSTDGPGYDPDLDCDQDGGVVSYITPSSFKVAFKKLVFKKDDGSEVDIIPDSVTLLNSTVYDLTSEITLSAETLPAGTYPSVEAEIYYYEIIMLINNPPVTSKIRVYLSDDDFASEGSLGHHQGDITMIDDDGNELGWVTDGLEWTLSNLSSPRGSINGAGGIDPETGHLRGLFGDTTLWNQSSFNQGDSKDIYVLEGELNLTVGDIDKTVTFSFNVKDNWFYEDFDDDETFNPCDSTFDACHQSAEWAPIFNPPDILVQ